MSEYNIVSKLLLIRIAGRIIPLKHKLRFLISDQLIRGKKLAIPYFRNWFICTEVTDINQSTLEDLMIGGVFSQPEVNLITKLRDKLPDQMTLVDVGGNIGSFFCQFIDKCDKVIVFEPIPRLHKVISESVLFNKDNKVQLIKKAVGEVSGKVQMPDNNNSNITNGLAEPGVLEISVTTLDNELTDLDKIDLLKIDVEGYELNVLNGATSVINKFRPRILLEVHPVYLENYGQDHLQVISFLEAHKYKISYYSFLEELRMSKPARIISRWKGNKGVQFANKAAFLKDIPKQPRISSYHFYCEPT